MTVEMVEIADIEAQERPELEATSKFLLEDVDPATLIATKNVRPVDVDAELLESVREHGLFQPIIATPYEGGYAVILGNQRRAAAVEAGRTVDVIVRTDLSADAARIVAQLVENMHRKDMRPTEVAAACAQLAIDLGLSEEEIAKKLSKSRKDVRASLALHEMPKAARDAADAGQLDLETATTLASFEADPKAYKRLLKATEDGNLPFALKMETRKREHAEQKITATARLQGEGVTIIPKPNAIGYGSREMGVYSLSNAEGERLTVEDHAECAGHAVYLENSSYSGVSEHYVCRDPKRYGHVIKGYYNYKSPEEAAAKAAAEEEARRAQAERAEAMAIALDLRTEFVQGLCRSKKVPKGVMRFALEVLFAHGYRPEQASMVLAYLGATEAGDDPEQTFSVRVGRIAEARQPLVVLALAATVAESHVQSLSKRWHSGDKGLALRWFEFLTGHGYELCDPEREFVDGLRKPDPEDEEDQDGEDWEDDEQEEQEEQEEDEEESEGTPAGMELSADQEDQEDETEPPSDGVSLDELYPEIDEPIAA